MENKAQTDLQNILVQWEMIVYKTQVMSFMSFRLGLLAVNSEFLWMKPILEKQWIIHQII